MSHRYHTQRQAPSCRFASSQAATSRDLSDPDPTRWRLRDRRGENSCDNGPPGGSSGTGLLWEHFALCVFVRVVGTGKWLQSGESVAPTSSKQGHEIIRRRSSGRTAAGGGDMTLLHTHRVHVHTHTSSDALSFGVVQSHAHISNIINFI